MNYKIEPITFFRDMDFELPQACAVGSIALNFLNYALSRIRNTHHFSVTMTTVSVVISCVDRLGFLLSQGRSDQKEEEKLKPYGIKHQELVQSLVEAVLDWCGRTLPKYMMQYRSSGKQDIYNHTLKDQTELQVFNTDRKGREDGNIIY